MKRAIETTQAPRAIGPYSQAMHWVPETGGGLLFLSGQIPLDPETGVLDGVDNIEVQTERVLRNIKGILESQKLSMAHVVKTTVYMTDLGEFSKMNDIYARHFPSPPPARTTVQVAALPKGARIEIEVIATTAV